MFPQTRHIHRFAVAEQSPHVDRVDEGFVNGAGIEDREFAGVGWDDRSVCEYRHTGHLQEILALVSLEGYLA